MFENYTSSPTNEIGRKTFFWYRVYCAILAALYLTVVIFGVLMAVNPFDTGEHSEQELFLMGIIYAVIGAILFIVFVTALFLPPKPYNWIVGIVLIGLGMTSCCFLPACIPLLIFWFKPETKAFFGRNN